MNEKERENLIEEAEVKKACRDFNEVWAEIEPRMEKIKMAEKKKRKRIITSIASFAACLVICCSVSIPIILKNRQDDIIYYFDNLTKIDKTEQQFNEDIINSGVDFVDFERFNGETYTVFVTDEGEVKGGMTKFTHITNSASYLIVIEFATTDVEAGEDTKDYDQSCIANGVEIKYKQISSNSGIYKYKTFATYKDVNYLCEIMTDTQDLTIFFNDFFAE